MTWAWKKSGRGLEKCLYNILLYLTWVWSYSVYFQKTDFSDEKQVGFKAYCMWQSLKNSSCPGRQWQLLFFHRVATTCHDNERKWLLLVKATPFSYLRNHLVRELITANKVVIIHNGVSPEAGGLSFYKWQGSCRWVLSSRKRSSRLDLVFRITGKSKPG